MSVFSLADRRPAGDPVSRPRTLTDPQQRILRAVAAGQVRRDELTFGRPSHAAGRALALRMGLEVTS